MRKVILRPINDAIFKYIFGYNRNIKYCEYLLECLLNKEKGYFKDKIRIINSLKLEKNGIINKEFEIDILVEYKDIIINIEPYTIFDDYSLCKSLGYISNSYLNQFKVGEKLISKNIIQYNIVKKSKYETRMYSYLSLDKKHIRLIKEKEYMVNIVNLNDIERESISEKCKRLLRYLNAEDMSEALKVARGDEMLMEIYNKTNGFINNNNEQMKIINKLYYEQRSYDNGSDERANIIARNMLFSGSDKNYVKKVTGLTDEELEEIKN